MARIERIEQPLKALALLSVIKEQRNNAKARRAIVSHCPCKRQKCDTRNWSDIVIHILEHIEKEHCNYSEERIICSYQQCNNSHTDYCQNAEDRPANTVFACKVLFRAPDKIEKLESENGDKESQHYILMRNVDISFKSKVERHFADERENSHPQKILIPVSCMDITFGNTESEDRHCKTADHPEPHHVRGKHIAHVIKDHADHGNDLEHRPV